MFLNIFTHQVMACFTFIKVGTIVVYPPGNLSSPRAIVSQFFLDKTKIGKDIQFAHYLQVYIPLPLQPAGSIFHKDQGPVCTFSFTDFSIFQQFCCFPDPVGPEYMTGIETPLNSISTPENLSCAFQQ